MQVIIKLESGGLFIAEPQFCQLCGADTGFREGVFNDLAVFADTSIEGESEGTLAVHPRDGLHEHFEARLVRLVEGSAGPRRRCFSQKVS